jgi:hypothetical protein
MKILLLLALLPFAALADNHLEVDNWDESFYWNVGLLASEAEGQSSRGWSTTVGYDRYNYEYKFSVGLEGSLLISPGMSELQTTHTTIGHGHNTRIRTDVELLDTGYNALTGALVATIPFVERVRIVGQAGYSWMDFDDGRTNNDLFWAAGFSRSFGQLQARVLYRDFKAEGSLNTLGVDFGISF